MGWADGFRPSLMNEPGSSTSDGQSIRETTSGGRWLLKNAVACSGCEKTALKKPSCACAAGIGEFPGVPRHGGSMKPAAGARTLSPPVAAGRGTRVAASYSGFVPARWRHLRRAGSLHPPGPAGAGGRGPAHPPPPEARGVSGNPEMGSGKWGQCANLDKISFRLPQHSGLF
jgi:hypothetical protein